MQIGHSLRSIVVEPLELPVKPPVDEPELGRWIQKAAPENIRIAKSGGAIGIRRRPSGS